MRTKTLLLTAALGAAGVASAVAQVYSVNAVGYINVPLNATPAEGKSGSFYLLCNQLNTGGNTLEEVIPHTSVPDGTTVYDFEGGAYVGIYPNDGGWGAGASKVFKPGKGFFVLLPKGAPATTITFVGEVPQGDLKTPLIKGLNLVGSQVPQGGAITTVLKLPGRDGDTFYVYDVAKQSYTGIAIYDGGWTAPEPTLAVAQAAFFRAMEAGSWDRTFSVNNP
jgi:hypothetical protein